LRALDSTRTEINFLILQESENDFSVENHILVY